MADKKSKDPKNFNFLKYRTSAIEAKTMVDGSDAMANKGYNIGFLHVPSAKEVYFKSFLTNYNETFKPEWSQETVYGRADPIYMFKNTTRTISVGLMMPAATIGEGYENLQRLQMLISFLYPGYAGDPKDANNNALTIAQSPLVRMKVMNLAQDSMGATQHHTQQEGTNEGLGNYKTDPTAKRGLLGVINNLTINYNIDNPEFGSFEVNTGGVVIPKAIELQFDFSVIHEGHLGWDPSKTFSQPAFPYGTKELGHEDSGAKAGAVGGLPGSGTEHANAYANMWGAIGKGLGWTAKTAVVGGTALALEAVTYGNIGGDGRFGQGDWLWDDHWEINPFDDD